MTLIDGIQVKKTPTLSLTSINLGDALDELDNKTVHRSGIETIAGNKTFSDLVSLTNSTVSTSTTTGAITISGGIGVNSNSFFNDIFNNNCISSIASISPLVRPNTVSGSNIAGISLILQSGLGTGTGALSNILFNTANTGSSGSTVQAVTEKMRLTGAGNLLIAKTTDDGVNKLQITGSASISATMACSTLTASSFVASPLLRTSAATGTNVAGISIAIQSGQGTGTGALPFISFNTPNLGVSGSTSQAVTEKMRLTGVGNLLINTTTDDAINRIQSNGSIRATQFRLSALNTAPISATDTGVLGEIRVDSAFIYVCIATNSWRRSALSIW
jgi:hypothetical protein